MVRVVNALDIIIIIITDLNLMVVIPPMSRSVSNRRTPSVVFQSTLRNGTFAIILIMWAGSPRKLST